MKLIFGLLLSVLLGFFVSENSNKLNPDSDVLIKVNAKVYKHGFFSFLILDKGKPTKETVFAYSYGNKSISITSIGSTYVPSGYSREGYMKSDEFYNKMKGAKMAKVFCAIDEGFFQLTNREKLALLNKCSAIKEK